MARLEKGLELGGYVLGEEIGRGGMGSVYRAHQPSLDRTVAIKILAPHLANDADLIERFEREARAAAKLDHPNIVTIYDVGEHDERIYYFAMQYLEGHNLEELIKKSVGGLEIDSSVRILLQVADALEYAHRHGVIHRDIKPANIMLDEEGRVVLMDFGIARAADASRLTRTGQTVGSPEYMSPEQISGEETDHRSDLYGLGVVMFEMLTGRVPYHGDTAVAIAFKHVHEEIRAPRDVKPSIPLKLDEICRRLLAKTPAERYDTAGKLIEDLEEALPHGATSPVAVRKPTIVAEPSARGSFLESLSPAARWGGAAAGGALVLALILWAVLGKDTPDTDGRQRSESASASARPESASSATFAANVDAAEIWIDGEFTGFSEEPLALAPGKYTAVARRDGCDEGTVSVTIVDRDSQVIAVELDCQETVTAVIASAKELFEQGLFEAAWAESAEALGMDPASTDARDLKGRIEKTLLVLNRSVPPDLGVRIAEARRLYSVGDVAGSLAICDEILAAKPDHRGARALHRLAAASGTKH